LQPRPITPERLTLSIKIKMGSITRDLYTPSPVYQAQTSDPAPVPTLYLIRHGQAEHNVNPSHVSRRDTILTEAGRLQAAKLRASLPNSSRRNIGVVVSSPLRRALQTALIGFEELILADRAKVIANGISDDSAATDQSQSRTQPFRLVALPEAQETSDLPCDTGLPVADLAAEFDALDSKWRGCVNFDLVSAEEWGSKTGRWACDRETLEKRARDTRIWLRQKMRQLSLSENHPTTTKGEKVHVRGDCVLVTHGGFLHLLTEDWEGFDAKAGQLDLPDIACHISSLLWSAAS
jgi:broad specificity phosphatase PhoE